MTKLLLRLAVAGTMLGATALLDPAAAQTRGKVTRETVDSLGEGAQLGGSRPSLSADGRFVAFDSASDDLVPNDTNQDSDVFVRDRATGVVQRVSLAWNGMEARDDSQCPDISADGRYVAFRSRAWNLYPGGANLGSPRWDAYVHDRQESTTTRVSVPQAGGDPDGDSSCPAISGDGQRVVFASIASNLVPGDDNGASDVFLHDLTTGELTLVSEAAERGVGNAGSEEPAISRDGRIVAFSTYATDLEPTGPLPPPFPWELPRRIYVRDLGTGTNALVSRAYDHPASTPNEDSRRPSLSDDGRYVAFESHAWNLVEEFLRPGHIYVVDRVTGETTVAGVQDPDLHYCNATPFASSCHFGHNHMPSISGDGRFVVFSSGSMRLVPANVQSGGTRVYLFDRLGGRLRRLSVTADRWEPGGCSENPVISADGKVVAYDAWDATIVETDENQDDDVFSTEWTCDDSGRCRTLPQCPAEPLDCAAATSSVLRLRKHPPGGVNEDTLFWRWAGAPAAEPFPDPAGDGLYQLCIYAKTLALDVAAPEAPACSGPGRPCWRTIPKGYKLFDPKGGLTSLTLTSSSGARRILARGKGPLLDAPFLPLEGAQGIVVQLQETGTGRCWGAGFATSSISRNVGGLPAIGSRRDGRLSARIP